MKVGTLEKVTGLCMAFPEATIAASYRAVAPKKLAASAAGART